MAEIKYKDVLADFITDIDNNPNLTDEEIFKAYPEFNNDKKLLDAAYQYRNTWKANDYDEPTLQSKFPEFFTSAQPTQPANPSVKANPAPTTEAEYQESLRRQDAASGTTNDPNQPFVAPQDDNQAYQEQMLRTSEAMRRNAERMAQPAELEAQIEGIKRWSRSKKKIVWFVLEDGTELPLRDIGDGMFLTLVPDANTGAYFGFTEEYLAIAGAKRVEKPSASV